MLLPGQIDRLRLVRIKFADAPFPERIHQRLAQRALKPAISSRPRCQELDMHDLLAVFRIRFEAPPGIRPESYSVHPNRKGSPEPTRQMPQ